MSSKKLFDASKTYITAYKPGSGVGNLVLGAAITKTDGKSDKVDFGKNDYNLYTTLFGRLNDNSIENTIQNEQHASNMFLKSIEDPIAFLKQKNEVKNIFDDETIEMRKRFFDNFLNWGMSTGKAEEISGRLAADIHALFNDVIDKIIFPSEIENGIRDRKIMGINNQLKNPLSKKTDEILGI